MSAPSHRTLNSWTRTLLAIAAAIAVNNIAVPEPTRHTVNLVLIALVVVWGAVRVYVRSRTPKDR